MCFMRTDPIKLMGQNRLINDYRRNNPAIMSRFEYGLTQKDLQDRVIELNDRVFKRNELSDVLYHLNKKWGAPDITFERIEQLRSPESVVVIGGQQAGLLTGPMYTINKIISIIQFAKKQETIMERPVIPVFWIAGEDHDFDEINHIYIPEKTQMKKHKIMHYPTNKNSISYIKMDHTLASDWVNHMFEQLQETEYTKDLYRMIHNCLEQSQTYVDFFARIIFQLFPDEGIVLIDSGDPKVRELERDYFVQMIECQPVLSKGVYSATNELKLSGYSVSVDIADHDAHLFYHHNNERILLIRDNEEKWIGKQKEVTFTTDELLEIAMSSPESLSNNVVTRPVMQELLFPTLAFIGGPGEISYWSVLKPAFKALNVKMPPVFPRLSFTLMDRNVAKILKKFAISEVDAVNNGVALQKTRWLRSQSQPPIEHMIKEMKTLVDRAHKPLRETAKNIRADLGDVAEKNLFYINQNIEFLEKKMLRALEQKYENVLEQFDAIDCSLRPLGGLQERVWNPFPLMNIYGTDFIKQMLDNSCPFEEDHYLVYM